jgi:hypothetical protein
MNADNRGEAALREGLELARAGAVDHDLDVPASETLIRAAEQRLGLRFPQLPEVSARGGCGAVDGEEFYGLVPSGLDRHGVPNAVWLYEDACRRGQPARYFAVYDYGDGTAVALDFDRPGPDGEVPCVAAHAGNWEQSEDVAADFGAFFLATVREVVDAEGTSA